MLRIKDQQGKTRFILRDDDEEPVDMDEFILSDESLEKREEGEENEEESKH